MNSIGTTLQSISNQFARFNEFVSGRDVGGADQSANQASTTGNFSATLKQTVYDEFSSIRPLGKDFYKSGPADLSPLGGDYSSF